MSEEKEPGNYEIGYGKPPTTTQFRKGVSGNPRGRPKKSRDFEAELIREANTVIVINENGRKKHVRKFTVAVKQLTKQAMMGDMKAQRLYFGLMQQSFGKAALAEMARIADLKRYDDPVNLSDAELMEVFFEGIGNIDLSDEFAAAREFTALATQIQEEKQAERERKLLMARLSEPRS